MTAELFSIDVTRDLSVRAFLSQLDQWREDWTELRVLEGSQQNGGNKKRASGNGTLGQPKPVGPMTQQTSLYLDYSREMAHFYHS